MPANWIDKAVSFLDPKAGLQRIRARAASEGLLRYEGAQRGRRTANWMTTGGSANAEIGPDLPLLRQRTRDFTRNNPYGRRALRVLNANTVGNKPEADTGDAKLDAVINSAFKIWDTQCDADGQLPFGGIERMMDRTVKESGEVIVRDRYRRPEDGFYVPYQVQVLEPDYLDSNKQWAPNDKGGVTIQGVEFDQLGQRTGYWMFPWHPGDVVKTVQGGFASKLIPAAQITHLYEKERPGQVRGAPWFASVLTSAYDLDGYDDAERMRKKIESCLSVFVELADGVEGSPIATTSTDAKTGNRIETVEPGMIEYLRPGEKINTAAPAAAGGYAEYLTKQERKLATGMGVMYEQMTGDLSLVNYSSIQAGRIEFKVDLEEYRDTTHIPGMQRIWNKFIDAAFLAKRIPEANYGCRWTPKPWQSVDAVKDAEANLLEVRSGRKTWGASVIEQGGEPAKQLARIAADNAAFDAAGVILDIDPRNVDRNRGAFQIKQTEAITDGSKKEA